MAGVSIHTGGPKQKFPPLEALIRQIDRQIDSRPHPFASDDFEALLGNRLGGIKRRGRQYLCFYLQDTQFAIPLQYTVEITYRTEITPLPNLPHWVLGICNLRGEIVSVVDLPKILGLPDRQTTLGAHLILIRHGQVTTGILADKIAGTIFDEDPNHHIEKKSSADEVPVRFIETVFVIGRQKIHLLTVPQLMAALEIPV